jgi:hypothetical protein
LGLGSSFPLPAKPLPAKPFHYPFHNKVAEKFPPEATLVDAIYELEFRQAVEEGLASLDRGERVPLEEARKRMPQWISRYSYP